MPKKPAKQIQVKGDVNIKDGDFVAGDKNIIHGGENQPSDHPRKPNKNHIAKAKSRDLNGNLDVSGGDVVFGDKVIKFFQDNLNIYLFRDIKQLALFLVFLVLVAGGIGGAYWYSKQPLRMTGNYNIAIAQFGESKNGTVVSPADAARISDNLFNFLDSEYRDSAFGVAVQVEHKNIPPITEDTEAEKLAKQINANIVIYGTVVANGDQATFQPRFFVAERSYTRELTGQHELADPIEFNLSQLDAQKEVDTELRSRTEVLFNFTKALIFFSKKDLDSALQASDAAISAAQKSRKSFAGEEVLFLLVAQIQTDMENYDAANQMLDQALTINPQYARAHLARGNILFRQATPPKSGPHSDPTLLEQAKAEYMIADQMPDPLGAYISIKAHTGIGNIFVVQAQEALQAQDANSADLFTHAIDNYTYVTGKYQQTQDPFLRSYASIAYFGLGAAYERQGEKEQAIRAYQQALDLTDDQDFKTRIEQRIKELRAK